MVAQGANVYGLANPLSPLIPLLHGDVAYRQDGSAAPDYLGDARAQAALASKWVAFFGSALGCVAAGFPSYHSNHTQRWLHARMAITQSMLDYFGLQLTLTLQYYGVPAVGEDMERVRQFLAGFGRGAGDDDICTASDCADDDEDEDDEQQHEADDDRVEHRHHSVRGGASPLPVDVE